MAGAHGSRTHRATPAAAPLASKTREPTAYPFVEAAVAAEVGLSDAQWTEYGRIAAGLHATRLPADLEAKLPREEFRPAWGAAIDALHAAAAAYDGVDPARTELTEFWQS